MHRNVTITIKNLCNVGWSRSDYELNHGKWTNDQLPTLYIAADPDNNPATPGMGLIECQKSTGSGYGTQGNCEYLANDNDHSKLLTIHWCDPYSHDPWTMASVPPPYQASVQVESADKSDYKVTVTLSPAPPSA